ncbi:hypothetical protein ACFWMS_29470, partial [Peribacillus butanolivorans]|uniref:hypothetical protein n=1 Tax=Peribacillus butanolivorans TaxID=421767 RepID=UPI00365AA39B
LYQRMGFGHPGIKPDGQIQTDASVFLRSLSRTRYRVKRSRSISPPANYGVASDVALHTAPSAFGRKCVQNSPRLISSQKSPRVSCGSLGPFDSELRAIAYLIATSGRSTR